MNKNPSVAITTAQGQMQGVGTGDLLAELRARFPKARLHYPPTLDCKRCSGTGVEPPKKLPSGTMLNAGPCACLFFGPNTKEMTGLIAQSARRLLSANSASEPRLKAVGSDGSFDGPAKDSRK